MVWFYHFSLHDCEPLSRLFQSHYGLILSHSVCLKNGKSEALTYWLSIPLWSDFILIRGIRIGLFVMFLSIPLWSDFIPQHRPLRHRTGDPFQSHYGLILSFNTIIYCIKNFKLSIPLWSDFILIRNSSNRKLNCTFNPTMVWFYRFVKRSAWPYFYYLSIPLWSDFIIVEKLKIAYENYTFNPTMVWFYLSGF